MFDFAGPSTTADLPDIGGGRPTSLNPSIPPFGGMAAALA